MNKTFASIMLVILFIYSMLIFITSISPDIMWVFRESPNTKICYELRTTVFPISLNQSMSPVDHKYCENK